MPHFKPTGPISLQGSGRKVQVKEWAPLGLKVLSRGPQQQGAPCGRPAAAHPADLLKLHTPAGGTGEEAAAHMEAGGEEAPCAPSSSFLQLASGSDCILSVRSDASVPLGCIVLDEVQQFNLHLLAGDIHQFRLFVAPGDQPHELLEVEGEVRLVQEHAAAQSSGPVVVDAAQLSAALSRLYFGHMVAANELLAVESQGVQLLVRVTAAHTLGEAEREEAIAYHCYRGLLTPSTSIFLTALEPSCSDRQPAAAGSTPATGTDTSTARSDQLADVATRAVGAMTLHERHGLRLVNVRTRTSRPAPTDMVHVTTSDGEWFPVKKKLLRPCLSLTKAVRDSGSSTPAVTVDVDCLTFDRVLLFLESHVLGKPPPQWSLHLVEDLAKAADSLGLQPLVDYCQQRFGQLAPRVCIHRYADVVAANARGELWLVLDAMVLDVKSWLPEHPGGASIIPRQSLNVDCARFFEMYHASRESFLYLRDFYIGEIHPDDRAAVPQGGEDKASGRAAEPPGPDFMQQLREYTEGFRLKLGAGGELLHGHAVKGHLGARD